MVSLSVVFGNSAFVITDIARAAQIVPDGQTATRVVVGGDAIDVTTTTVYGQSALNSFGVFDIDGGDVVNLHLPSGAHNILNLVHSRTSHIDGVLNSLQDGRVGGNVYFLNPYGLVVGTQGVLNVGGLTVVTPPPVFMQQFFRDPSTSVSRVLSGDTGVHSEGIIEIRGEINSTHGIALNAGEVVATGHLAVDITKSPVFDDLVNPGDLEIGDEIRITNGSIEIVAVGDITNSAEISTYGHDDIDAGDITIEAGGSIVLGSTSAIVAAGQGANSSGGDVTVSAAGSITAAEGSVVDARGGVADSFGGNIRLVAAERIEAAGEVYGGSSYVLPAEPEDIPERSGAISLTAPEITVSGIINAGSDDFGISSGDVFLTAERPDGGVASIRLDGAEVTGHSISAKAVSTVSDDSAAGIVQRSAAATIDIMSSDSDRYTWLMADRDISILAESNVSLTISPDTESDDSYDAAYAISGVDSTSRVHIGGYSFIEAVGDLEVGAKNTVAITSSATAVPDANGDDYVGGSVAVNKLTTLTEALISGDAEIYASSVAVTATSDNTVTTTAIAPSQGAREDASEDPQQQSQMKKSLNEYRDDAKTSEGEVTVAAALAINDVVSTTRAGLESNWRANTYGRVDVVSNSIYNSSVTADASTVGQGSDGTGAAVGINRVSSKNAALISSGATAFDGISVVAKMNDDTPENQKRAKMDTVVVSGAGSGDTGVAGALAVNVQHTDSAAYINQDAATADGSIDILSLNLSENSVKASPGRSADDVTGGIGASVAVNVAVNSSSAGVADDAMVTYLSAGGGMIPVSIARQLAPESPVPNFAPSARGVNITASSDHIVTTEAEAGAVGGTAVTPAVALSLVETATKAEMGLASSDVWNSTLYVDGDLSVEAESKESITTTAKGSSDAESAAIGTALAISLVDSTSEAIIERSINAGGEVTIGAQSMGATSTSATASAKGGKAKDASTPEDGVDKKVGEQTALAQKKRDGTKGEDDESDADNGRKKTPSAETSEGKASVAAAVGVNAVTSTTSARVADDVNVTVGGGLELSSAANTDTSVKADGSTVDGNRSGVGVGAAVAINQATLVNEAYLGSGDHFVHGLTIEAKTLEAGSGESGDRENTHSAEAISGAGASRVGVAGSLALNLTDSRTAARIGEDAVVVSDRADATLSAADRSRNIAKAVPTKSEAAGDKTGVGASVAVNVALGETLAELADEAYIVIVEAAMGLSATGDHAMETVAQAGAEGGVAVTPAAALSVSEHATVARLGTPMIDTGEPEVTIITGDLTVEAQSKESITTTAKGSSDAESAAIGAALAISLVDSTSEAITERGIHAGGEVTIGAQSMGTTSTSATASAKGGEAKDASTPEDGVDKKVGEQTALAQKKRGETKGEDDANESDDPADESDGDSGGKQAPSAETSEGQVSVAAAVGINIVTSTTRARAADGVDVTAGGDLKLSSAANTDTSVKADGSTVDGNNSGAGIGAAVAINQATLVNEAYLGTGDHLVSGLTIEAKTLETGAGKARDEENKHSAEAVSGAGASKIGVAGSLAINLGDSRMAARIGEDAAVTVMDGDVSLTAADRSRNVAKALPTKSEVSGEKAGVGASVAVNVALGETLAELADRVDVTASSMSLSATGDHGMETVAQAGAAGGVAVTPAAALSVSEHATVARLGTPMIDTGEPEVTIITGDLTVKAQSKESITTTAKGSSDAETAAIGAALAISLANSTAEAVVERSIGTAGKATIQATSTGATHTSAIASAKGGREEDASTPEDGVDKKVGEQTALAQKKRAETKGEDANESDDPADESDGDNGGKQAPSAETSEGKASVAAAVGVNLVTSTTSARVADDVNVTAGGGLKLSSAANTDTSVRADGSTVDGNRSDVGVGAAVAINQATQRNEAYLGTGTHSVNGLEVEAKTLETGSGESGDKDNTHSAEAVSGAGASKVGVAGSLAINLTDSRTAARIGEEAIVGGQGGDVSLLAVDRSTNIAKASPTKGEVSGEKAGVGASVAMNVVLGETLAELADGAAITASSMSLSATGDHGTKTEALAGAAGGVAVTPVVAIAVSDQKTAVATGRGSDISVKTGFSLQSKHISSVTTLADGNSEATSVAVGAAVALAFVTDSSEARLAGAVESAGDVSLEARQATSSTTSAKANLEGGKEEDEKTPEDGVDRKLQEQTDLAQKKKDEAQRGDAGGPSVLSDELESLPSAQTDEGKVSVAGAISANVSTSSVRAYTADGASVEAEGSFSIGSLGSYDASATADGSAVDGSRTNVGVGAAVAVNKVTSANEAYLGSGQYVVAKGITIQAGMMPKAYATSVAEAISGAGSEKVGVAGSLALHIADSVTVAQIREGAVVEANDTDVVLIAEGRSGRGTRASPGEGGSSGGSVGVGASVAILSLADTTEAGVEEAADLSGARNLTISASSDHDSETEARAGASGGVAIDSVVGLTTISQRTRASIGAGSLLSTSGGVSLHAVDTGDNGVTAIGDTESGNVGVGSSVALITTDSDISAVVDRDLGVAGDIDVVASATRRYETTASASAKGATDTTGGEPKNTSSKALDDNQDAQQGTRDDGKVLAAAAVAISYIDDDVRAAIYGGTASDERRVIDTAGNVKVNAVNLTNFSSRADGSTASLETTTGLSNGVALSILRNDTEALIGDYSSVSGANDISVSAVSESNTDAAYRDKLAAEALSGSGAKKAGVAGALAVTYSSASTNAYIGHATDLDDVGDVLISSDNTSKLSAKAWGGAAAKVGVGASVATIVSENEYRAYLGDDVLARVGSLDIRTRNHRIHEDVPFEYEDFKSLNLRGLLGESNYYTEALAGSGGTQVAVTGSYAVNVLDDTASASIGSGTIVYSDGSVRIDSQYDTSVRAITGGVVASGKVGVGTAHTSTVNSSTVLSTLFEGAHIADASSVGITAAADTDIGSFAASAAAADQTGVAGVSSLVVSSNYVEASMGDDSGVFIAVRPELGDDDQGDLFIRATNEYKGLNIAGDAAGGSTVGIGAALATNFVSNATNAFIGEGAEARAYHGIDLAALSTQDLRTVAAGGAGGEKVGVAASSTVNTLTTQTHAYVGYGAGVNRPRWPMPVIVSPEQYVSITATDDTKMISVAGGGGFGGKAGVGAGIDVGVIGKDTQAFVASHQDAPTLVNAYNTLRVQALSSEEITSISGGLPERQQRGWPGLYRCTTSRTLPEVT
jgi:filamentous hemagglutinin family protein